MHVQNENTPCRVRESRGPCNERENLFNYSMVTGNWYRNYDIMLKPAVKMVVDRFDYMNKPARSLENQATP